MQQRTHSCLHDILPGGEHNNPDLSISQGRTSQRQSARSLQAGEYSKSRNRIRSPSKAATGWTTRYACDGRVVLAGHQHGIEFWIIVRRAQDRAQSRNTQLPSTQSSKPETKQSSAFVRSAVSKSESKCKLSIFSANTLQNSVHVTYARDVSLESGRLGARVIFALCSPLSSALSNSVSLQACKTSVHGRPSRIKELDGNLSILRLMHRWRAFSKEHEQLVICLPPRIHSAAVNLPHETL
jgi:hypothetical protein